MLSLQGTSAPCWRVLLTPEPVVPVYPPLVSELLFSPLFSPSAFRYQYILVAATSPATKLNEETLTYLNQGMKTEAGSIDHSNPTKKKKKTREVSAL